MLVYGSRAINIIFLLTGMFSGLQNCTKVSLADNKIHTIQSGTFQDGLTNVQSLILSTNRITEIKPYTFFGLDKCSELALSDNRIHRIHSRALESMVSLNQLWLHENQLTSIPWTIFGKKHPAQLEVTLKSNPLVCNLFFRYTFYHLH